MFGCNVKSRDYVRLNHRVWGLCSVKPEGLKKVALDQYSIVIFLAANAYFYFSSHVHVNCILIIIIISRKFEDMKSKNTPTPNIVVPLFH